MANAVKWDDPFVAQGNVLSTELNSLGNGSRTNAGTAFDNSASLHQYACLELNVQFGSNPSSGATVDVFMIMAPDGTNYGDGSSSVSPGTQHLIAVIQVNANTNAQRLHSRMFTLPPCKVKFLLNNNTGQSFPASGSTLKLFTANDELQ